MQLGRMRSWSLPSQKQVSDVHGCANSSFWKICCLSSPDYPSQVARVTTSTSHQLPVSAHRCDRERILRAWVGAMRRLVSSVLCIWCLKGKVFRGHEDLLEGSVLRPDVGTEASLLM